MATDRILLDLVCMESAQAATYVRFYQWAKPTLSIGYFQNEARAVDFNFCRSHDIAVVRRPTGGRAVLHDMEVTYAVVSNDADFFRSSTILESYRKIALALGVGFRGMGLSTTLAEQDRDRNRARRMKSSPACFALSNHYEILCEGKKLVGSAQRRFRNGFLQHGSILLDFNPSFLEGAIASRGDEALSQVTSLRDCLGERPAFEQVVDFMAAGFRQVFEIGFEPFFLDADFLECVNNRAREHIVLAM